MTHPVSMETSTGDGLLMAMKAGAMISNMREAWWIPVGDVPVEDNPLGRILVNGQRTLPHSIMVNRRGRRFTNEAANYNAFGAAFHVEDVSRFEYANLPCWLIFDQNYVDTYGFRVAAGGGGGQVPAWVPRGDTPAELARSLGIDGEELERDDRALERAVRRGPRSRLRARRQRVRLLVGRSASQGSARRHARPARPRAVLRLRDPQRGARHQGRAAGRSRRPGARPRRRPDRRALRRRQRDGIAVRHDLRRAGRHARPGDGLRLPRRPPRRQPLTSDRRRRARRPAEHDAVGVVVAATHVRAPTTRRCTRRPRQPPASVASTAPSMRAARVSTWRPQLAPRSGARWLQTASSATPVQRARARCTRATVPSSRAGSPRAWPARRRLPPAHLPVGDHLLDDVGVPVRALALRRAGDRRACTGPRRRGRALQRGAVEERVDHVACSRSARRGCRRARSRRRSGGRRGSRARSSRAGTPRRSSNRRASRRRPWSWPTTWAPTWSARSNASPAASPRCTRPNRCAADGSARQLRRLLPNPPVAITTAPR